MEQGGKAIVFDIADDAVDHFRGRQRLAKDLDRQLPTLFRHDIARWTPKLAQLPNLLLAFCLTCIDPPNRHAFTLFAKLFLWVDTARNNMVSQPGNDMTLQRGKPDVHVCRCTPHYLSSRPNFRRDAWVTGNCLELLVRFRKSGRATPLASHHLSAEPS